MDTKPITSADEINADEWEPVTTIATGRTYAIRRVWPKDLAASGLLALPGVDSLDAVRDRMKAGKPITPEEQENLRVFADFLICLGVVDPKVSMQPRGECPPGAVSIEAIASDKDELFFAIRQKSHFGDEAVSAEPDKGHTFRADESAPVAPGAEAQEPVSH